VQTLKLHEITSHSLVAKKPMFRTELVSTRIKSLSQNINELFVSFAFMLHYKLTSLLLYVQQYGRFLDVMRLYKLFRTPQVSGKLHTPVVFNWVKSLY
jgi:hypothetical protein